MTRLIYDGTFEGLLTVVFEIYDRKFNQVTIQKAGDSDSAMFEDVLNVSTDEHRATRVLTGLRKKLSANGVQRVYVAHLAGIINEENNIVGFIRYAFDSKQNIEENYGN